MNEHRIYQEDLELINLIDLSWDQLDGSSILITGANGLIGSVIVDSLLYRNEKKSGNIDIWVLSRNESTLRWRFGEYVNKKYFHYVLCDVVNEFTIDAPIDYIIHGASKGDPYSFATDPVGIMNANYIGMYHILEMAKKKKVKKILFISSGEVYGMVSKEVLDNRATGITEQDYGYLDSTNARNSYASSKKAAETLCIAYVRQYGLDVTIARPCHTYGSSLLPSDNRVVGEFIRNALANKDIVMKSQGIQRRSYCYVADTVAAIWYLLIKGKRGEAYNIANSESTVSIKELAELISNIANVKISYVNPDEMDLKGYSTIMHAILDPGKLSALGWYPRMTLKEGICRTMQILKESNSSPI